MAGYPEPTISWHWNGKPLIDNGKVVPATMSSLGLEVFAPSPEQMNLIIPSVDTTLQGK